MKKIIVENFDIIQFAEIDLDKVVIFTGDNNSGKSLILSLIKDLSFLTMPSLEEYLLDNKSVLIEEFKFNFEGIYNDFNTKNSIEVLR